MIIQNCQPIDLPTVNGSRPIRCFGSPDLLPDEPAARQLERLASLPGVRQYVAVLPDVHYKGRNPTPTGTVTVTKDVLIPRAVDQGINCGMRAMTTNIPARDLTPRMLDDLFGTLIKAIPLKEHEAPLLSPEQCLQVLVHGQSRLADYLGLPDDEVTRTENNGRMMAHVDAREIEAVIGPKAIRKGAGSLGTVGAGNHFLELQEVDQVLDDRAARILGVHVGEVVFMLHSDSRKLGKRIVRPLREEAEPPNADDNDAARLWSVPVDSDLGRRYVCALAAASHAGYANRAAVTHILRRTLRAVLGDEGLNVNLLFDCGHETIQPEEHQGDVVWVHRHGASRALPASHLGHDPVLGDLGQPVPIPGCMGSPSYLGVAGAGAALSFCSVAHGAGRVMEKATAAEVYDPAQIESDLHDRGVRLYRYHADNIAGQAPASFKNVAHVMDAMTDLDLIRPVARLRPIAVLKG